MTLPPLLQSEIKALTTLANEGPTNIYQIAKKSGKRYSLMFKAIKNLEKRPLVRFIEENETSKGTKARIYDLNFWGILLVLKRELSFEDPEKWDSKIILKIIEKYANWLPLVLGKWDFFKEMNVERIAFCRLKAILDRLDIEKTHYMDFLGFGGPFVPLATSNFVVSWLFYFIGFFPINADFEVKGWEIRTDNEEWLKALKHDKEIVTFFLRELELYQHNLRKLWEIGDILKKRLIDAM